MSTQTVVTVIAVAAIVLLVVVIAAVLLRHRRSAQLRDTFGSEYDRTVEESGKRRRAERELQSRREEHDSLQLRELTPAARDRYTREWTAVQATFVDAPVQALTQADTLVTRLMAERGYPTEDFDEQARLLSVEHGQVLEGYRAAHQVELASREQKASTESIRRAMLDFRQVFEDLMRVGDEPYPADEVRTEGRSPLRP
jgi:hypothetical protein